MLRICDLNAAAAGTRSAMRGVVGALVAGITARRGERAAANEIRFCRVGIGPAPKT